MQSLAEAKAGESCEIKWMFGSSYVLEYLKKRGIKEGSIVRVLSNRKDGIIIALNQLRLVLGREAAERITV